MMATIAARILATVFRWNLPKAIKLLPILKGAVKLKPNISRNK